MEKKLLVVLSGAGVSAESGINTFRDSNGLWEQYRVEDVASIEGWYKNPELVIEFYNKRRKEVGEKEPNAAHKIIAELEQYFNVVVITQNVDNLHERAGSTQVIHLHGEVTKVCSEKEKGCVEDIGYRAIRYGERAADGGLLRPFIVWFGEAVPLIETAEQWVAKADLFLVIGTSLNVYPAAGLLYEVSNRCPIFVIDPKEVPTRRKVHFIREKATIGMEILKNELIDKYIEIDDKI